MAEPGPDPEKPLSEAQAAAALRIHPKTLARWRRAKLIAHDRSPGGRIAYRWGDLITFRRAMHVTVDAPTCSDMLPADDAGIA